jgi:predicted transcriptional regulator YdeE
MNIEIVERSTFCICGYWIETTLEQNDKDVAALYDDFFSNGKEEILMKLQGSKKGYYGLSWYTQSHERYCYLLGIEVEQKNIAPENTILKELVKTTYAVARFPKGENIIKAWTEFFYHAIPDAGFHVNAEYNLYFEYYPSSVKDEFELWVPVVSVKQ